MKLESVVKYHNPRSVSPFTRQSSRSPDDMTGSDVMTALGMTQKRAPLGYSAFFGKMHLSPYDRDRAMRLLAMIGMKASARHPALTKLPEEECMAVIKIIAGYAFLDYARSPDTESPCHACNGSGQRNGKCCSKCNGKGVVRAACKDCKGRGEAVNRVMTRFQGVPVYQPCKRCSGHGVERITSAVVYRAVCQVTDAITLDTWNKSVKQLHVFLIAELYREEAWAERQLMNITKS